MSSMQRLPYWRLSSFYFFYFAFLGALLPFWQLYLSDTLRLDASAIAIVSAIMMATRIIGPWLWGALADKLAQHLLIVRLGALLAAVSFLGIYVQQSFWQLALVVFCYSFFWNAILSQYEAVSFDFLSHFNKAHEYAWVRVWGSVGFVIMVFGLGWVFEWLAIEYLLPILSALLVAIFFSSLATPNPAQHKTGLGADDVSVVAFVQGLMQKQRGRFLIICLGMQIAFGAYYTFFSIYLESNFYSSTQIGLLWGVAVVAEILLFLVMPRILLSCCAKHLLLFCLFTTALRWALTPVWVDNTALLFLLQCQHAISFGLFHGLSMQWIRTSFSDGEQGKAQASYSALSYGVGGVTGALLAGFLWQRFASADNQGLAWGLFGEGLKTGDGVFYLSAIICAGLFMLALNIKPEYLKPAH